MENCTFLLLIACLFVATIGETENADPQYTIDTPYEYPILPDTQEWIDLENVVALREACQIPEKILHNMTTDALFQTVINYPFMVEMYAFDTIQIGYETVRRRFNGLRELENRTDCIDVMMSYLQESYSLDESERTLKDDEIEKLYFMISGDSGSVLSSGYPMALENKSGDHGILD